MEEIFKRLNFYSYRLEVRAEGFRLARLITALNREKITIYGIKPIDDFQIEFWISYRDLKTLKKIAKSKYKIRVIGEKGILYKSLKLIKNTGLVIGIFLGLCMVLFYSNIIDRVEISGYEKIPEHELRACLEDAGIYPGVIRKNIDWLRAEEAIFDTFPQVSWLNLVYDGRVVYLKIAESQGLIYTENEVSKEDEGIFIRGRDFREKIYSNILADRSAYIEKINVKRGHLLVQEGDFVKKGSPLISGVVPIEPTTFDEDDPKAYYVRAEGDIWARVPYRFTLKQENYIGKTDVDINRKIQQQLRQWIKENLGENDEILNKSLNFSRKKNIIEVGVTLEVCQQIGKEQEIIIG